MPEDASTGFTPRGKAAQGVLEAEASRSRARVGGTVAAFQPELLLQPSFEDDLAELLALVDSVRIVVPWYQADAASSSFARHPRKTPTDASLRHAIGLAHDAGAEVLLSPWVDAEDGSWRGAFRPRDEGAWFAAYAEFVAHYAQLAEDEGVAALCLGSEYSQLEDERWSPIIDRARLAYGGKLTYAANWNATEGQGGYQRVPFWPELDAVGIDAWFPLAPGEPQARWRDHAAAIDEWHGGERPPIWFTEFGARSVQGALARPWAHGDGGVPDEAAQARAYEAFFAVPARRDWLEAAWFWWWDNESTSDWVNGG